MLRARAISLFLCLGLCIGLCIGLSVAEYEDMAWLWIRGGMASGHGFVEVWLLDMEIWLGLSVAGYGDGCVEVWRRILSAADCEGSTLSLCRARSVSVPVSLALDLSLDLSPALSLALSLALSRELSLAHKRWSSFSLPLILSLCLWLCLSSRYVSRAISRYVSRSFFCLWFPLPLCQPASTTVPMRTA